jgi:copper chaperone CopZ
MSSGTETILRVVGMSCGSCARHVGDALRKLPGVEQVEVKLDEGSARVQHDQGTAREQLIAAVTSAGYEAQ